jgi:DNA/RNA-binding domain of Phe-tRNA-synthetase-like protein
MRYAGDEPEVRPGLVAPELAAEHPGLQLAWTEVEASPGPTPPELRERLRAMADRIHGADAIAMRTREVPHAHRVFFRHVGLDPDVVRTPVEAVVLRRMQQGGLRPQGLIADALTVATLDTGVGVWAFDAAALVGALALRSDGGRLVIADEQGPVAMLFREPGERAAVSKRTRRLALAAVAVPGVPELFVQEALWTAWDILA